jgi:hypothetical protein
VVAATAELTQIAVNAMNEPIMATPAVAGGLLIVRTLNHVYGIAAD